MCRGITLAPMRKPCPRRLRPGRDARRAAAGPRGERQRGAPRLGLPRLGARDRELHRRGRPGGSFEKPSLSRRSTGSTRARGLLRALLPPPPGHDAPLTRRSSSSSRGLEGPLAVATNKPGKFRAPDPRRASAFSTASSPSRGDRGRGSPTPLSCPPLLARRRPGRGDDPRRRLARRRRDRSPRGVSLAAVLWGIGSREELTLAGAREDELVATPGDLLARLERGPPSR